MRLKVLALTPRAESCGVFESNKKNAERMSKKRFKQQVHLQCHRVHITFADLSSLLCVACARNVQNKRVTKFGTRTTSSGNTIVGQTTTLVGVLHAFETPSSSVDGCGECL